MQAQLAWQQVAPLLLHPQSWWMLCPLLSWQEQQQQQPVGQMALLLQSALELLLTQVHGCAA